MEMDRGEAWRVVTGQCRVSTASHAACEHGHVIAAVGRIWLECGSDREFQANSHETGVSCVPRRAPLN